MVGQLLLLNVFMYLSVLEPAAPILASPGQPGVTDQQTSYTQVGDRGPLWRIPTGQAGEWTSGVGILRSRKQGTARFDAVSNEGEDETSLLEMDGGQPGLMDEDEVDQFAEELVDYIRQLRVRAWILDSMLRRGLRSRLPSLRQASERLQAINSAHMVCLAAALTKLPFQQAQRMG